MNGNQFRALTAVATALFALGAARSVQAEVVGCKVDSKDPKRVLVLMDGSDQPRILRTFKSRVIEVESSKKGKYVGALVLDPESKASGLYTFTFHVLDNRGKSVTTVKNAQGFSFSPDDRYVAVTKGKPIEGATGFLPDETRIVDLRRNKTWAVPELKDATEVDWADLPDEGLSLLAKLPAARQRIHQYRLANKKTKETDWKGLHFSPDGKYYYLTPQEAIDQGLCKPDKKDDSCLRAFSWKNKETKMRLRKRFRRAFGWADKGHKLVIEEGFDEEGMEVDLENGRQRILKERLDRGWKTRRGVRLLRKRAKRLEKELDELRRRFENR